MRLTKPLDDRSSWSAVGRCPIEKTLGVVGSRPAMLIMREAHYGSRRFDEFVERVGIAPATASVHLKTLTSAGLLERQRYQESGERGRDEYLLTEAGLSLAPILVSLFEWGKQYTGSSEHLEYAHEGCGSGVHVRLSCASGHEVENDEIEVRSTQP